MDRFYNKVEFTSNCWIWRAYKNSDGYGTIRYKGKMWKAHRLSYFLHHGDIGDKLVMHSCDNPSCVNPGHLSLGTNKDNMSDRGDRGRTNRPVGEKNPKAKLTEQKVKEIKMLFNKLKRKEIAKLYNVKIATIDDIKYNKRWKHVITEKE